MPFAPSDVRACESCGHLIFAVEFPSGATTLRDPGFADQDLIRSLLGRDEVARRGFASLVGGGPHDCPAPPAAPIAWEEHHVN